VLVQDTFWILCGFPDIANMSNSCHSSPGRDSAAQKLMTTFWTWTTIRRSRQIS
jgi:hypothetical protein